MLPYPLRLVSSALLSHHEKGAGKTDVCDQGYPKEVRRAIIGGYRL